MTETQSTQAFRDPFVAEDLTARFFRSLADPTRLKILTLLLEGEKNVGELTLGTGASQSGVSNHLSCLRWCGFVAARREGRSIYYSINDSRVMDVINLASDMISDHAESISSCVRLDCKTC